MHAGATYTINFWNRVPENNLLNPQTSLRQCKLANCKACDSGGYANANANASSHYQTPIKLSTVHQKQVEYDDSLLRQIWVF